MRLDYPRSGWPGEVPGCRPSAGEAPKSGSLAGEPLARVGVIDRSSQEATSPLGAALYVCYPRLVNGYCSD